MLTINAVTASTPIPPKINPWSIVHEINIAHQWPAAYSRIIKKEYLENKDYEPVQGNKGSARSLYNALLRIPSKSPFQVSEALSKIAYTQAAVMAQSKT
jgi:hypothetical protein